MRKSSVKALAIFRHFKKYRLETGFSMLEAVVVVGVLLALAVGGFISYGPIIDNAKKAKVKSAATEIYTAVTAASFDGDSTTTPEDTIRAFNDSNDTIHVEILDPVAELPAMSTSAAMAASQADFCIQANDRAKPNIKARVGTCAGVPDDSGPGGSSPSATFVRITDGPEVSPKGIRYINAVLADDASAAQRSQDRDTIFASSENVEREAAYLELDHFEVFIYDVDPYYRIDSGLPALNDDYQSKLSSFTADPTVTNQQAMVTAHRALFAAVVAHPTPEPERILVPSPSNPEKFQGVTIAAGTGGDAVVRVAIPTSLYKTGGWTVGASWLEGIELGGVSPDGPGIDGEYTYWDVTIRSATLTTTPEGVVTGHIWKAGVYDAFLTAMDNRGVSRSMNFRITVE